MKGLVVTLIIVFAALVVAGILIFSGNDMQDQLDQTQNQGTQIGGANEIPENSQTGTEEETQNQPQTYSVEIRGYAYNPSTLNVKVGDTVTWTNKDGASHTVTSDSGTELDSSYLSGTKVYSHTFTTAGTYEYHCRPHPYMEGTVVVE